MISPLAFVHPSARLGNDVTVDAFAYIDQDVTVGDHCHIRPHASVLAGTELGSGVTVYEGAIVGACPQDFRWKGAPSKVVVGQDTCIREQVIINRSIHEGGATRIGSHSFLMAQTHVGHDSCIGDYCVLGNGVKIAGDCKIGNYSVLSSGAIMHEKAELGEWVLIKGGCRINGNVPPYLIMAHNPARYGGVNAFILKKGNFSDEDIENAAKCYRHLYQSGTSAYNAVIRMKDDLLPGEMRDSIIGFIERHQYRVAALVLERDDA